MTLFFVLLATSALADPVSPAPPNLVQELVPFQQWHEVAGVALVARAERMELEQGPNAAYP